MEGQTNQRSFSAVWRLAERQHGVVTRRQLSGLGFSQTAIDHRIARGLHRLHRGVFALGRPETTLYGRWMATVLYCGPDAVLSHLSAWALWEIRAFAGFRDEVTAPNQAGRRPPGIAVHRRALAPSETTRRHGIPVTSPACTLVDLANRLATGELERAVNEADRLELIGADELREELDHMTRRPGLGVLKGMLDRRTFQFTDSELERRFLVLLRAAGLPEPETGRYVAGFKVDFYWPQWGLVVETDGLRYHRTPAEQARDRLRDQAHATAGLTPLRFTHAQVRHSPGGPHDARIGGPAPAIPEPLSLSLRR